MLLLSFTAAKAFDFFVSIYVPNLTCDGGRAALVTAEHQQRRMYLPIAVIC